LRTYEATDDVDDQYPLYRINNFIICGYVLWNFRRARRTAHGRSAADHVRARPNRVDGNAGDGMNGIVTGGWSFVLAAYIVSGAILITYSIYVISDFRNAMAARASKGN
jgi:hypothetical protein